jgi:mRNA-degrading endonuclease RelE of RelBE toxin-antitoxin system
MSWTVRFHKKTAKGLKKLPKKIHDALVELVNDIIASGPVRGDWTNYSKLADGSHHCHLNYSYVVVWVVVNNEIKIVEVTYVGSRENAPY